MKCMMLFAALFVVNSFAKSVLKDEKFGKYKEAPSMIIDGESGGSFMIAEKFQPGNHAAASSSHVRLVSGETDHSDVIEPPPALPPRPHTAPRAVPLPTDLKSFFASLPENVDSERIVVGESLSAPASIVYDDSVDPFEADHRIFAE